MAYYCGSCIHLEGFRIQELYVYYFHVQKLQVNISKLDYKMRRKFQNLIIDFIKDSFVEIYEQWLLMLVLRVFFV